MEELGFKFPASANKSRLIYLLHRAERGLLSYDKCSVAELQRFAVDRRLTGRAVKPSSKASLVKKLEHADRRLQFHSFMGLSPEIRCMIYEFHFSTFETVEAKPLPITQVSQLVKRESLPLFYKRSRFMVRISSGYDYDGIMSYGVSGFVREKLFNSVANNISRIRSLRLELERSGTYVKHRDIWTLAWDLNLFLDDDDERVVEVDAGSNLITPSRNESTERKERLEKVLSEFGKQKMGRGVLKAIVRACDMEHDIGMG